MWRGSFFLCQRICHRDALSSGKLRGDWRSMVSAIMSHVEATKKTLTLADGRQVGYALYGAATGQPLFFAHGWPGSRLRAAVYHGVALRLHIRLIALDRPGIGLSS